MDITKRSIVFLTGTRADFGKLEPLAHAAQAAGFGVEFFVTGMHMLRKYGMTKEELRKNSSFSLVEFINQRADDPLEIVLSKTITGFSDYLEERSPDLVIAHGDRVEALAAALVCSMKYIRCAHIEGGEVSGTIDEIFRHCNTKLSAFHFVSSEAARRRVLRLGEASNSVIAIGSPELDIHAQPTGLTAADVRTRYEIPFDDYGICIFHTVTSEQETIAQQAQDLFSSLEKSKRNFVVILPNNDPGNEGIFEAIRDLPEERFRILPSMRFLYFSELMRSAKVIVGNSSLGVREAPFLGIPSLDIGTRQANRAKSPSIRHATAAEHAVIADFLSENWGHRYSQSSDFGQGNASAKFVEIISSPEFWSRPLQKYFDDGVE